MNKSKVYQILSSLNKIKWSIALKGILSGLVAGILVVLYRLGIEYGTETAGKIYILLKAHPLTILPWILFVVSIGLFISWLLKFEPMATGSGIPQVEGLLLYGLKMKWYLVLFIRFLGGIIASFFGVSLGREGPSIQIGASGSQALAKRMSKTTRRKLSYYRRGGSRTVCCI